LAGIQEAGGFDARQAGSFVGTSAGSIVAGALAGGVSARSRLGEQTELPAIPSDESQDEPLLSKVLNPVLGIGGALAAPVAALALTSTARPGAMARRAALGRAPRGRRDLDDLGRMVDGVGVTFDGRLLVAALELETGRRVVFGADGAPEISVAEAIKASCAIPGVFSPVRAHGRTYVDGGALIAFQPDGDLEDEVQRLKDAGVEFPDEISEHPWGRIVPFKDPDGNDLQLYTPPS